MSDDLGELCERALAESPDSEGEIVIDSNRWAEAIEHFRQPLVGQLTTLLTRVRAAVPNDISYLVTMSSQSLFIQLRYQDGTMTWTHSGFFPFSDSGLFEILHSIDWNDFRACALKHTAKFARSVCDADDRPAQLPSSREAADRLFEPLRDKIRFAKSLVPRPDFGVVLALGGKTVCLQILESKEAVVSFVADTMPQGHDVLAVLERGIEWTFEEIELTKGLALDRLGPVSRAKAERRLELTDQAAEEGYMGTVDCIEPVRGVPYQLNFL